MFRPIDWLHVLVHWTFAFFVGKSFVGGSQCGEEHGDDGSDSERKTSWHVHVVSGNLTCLTLWLNLHKFASFHLWPFLIGEGVFYCFGFPLMCLHWLRDVFYLLYVDFHPCLYIYRFHFYLLEVVTSNQGCAGILFIQKYLSITNKSILYYLH